MKLMHMVPEVVRMRSEGSTLEEIGKRFNLSRQRINQIEQAAQMHEAILKLWGFPFSVGPSTPWKGWPSRHASRPWTFTTPATSAQEPLKALGG